MIVVSISEYSEIPEGNPVGMEELHLLAVTAADDTAPQGTLNEQGEWAVHNGGEWIIAGEVRETCSSVLGIREKCGAASSGGASAI